MPDSRAYVQLGAVATLEQQQLSLQVCENHWIRIIAGVKRVEKRRMTDIRETLEHRFA